MKQSFRPDDIFENVLPNMAVDCTQRIVQVVDVRIVVNSPSQTHTLFLAAAQINPLKMRR